MAKQIDYPRAGLKSCLELAQAVDDLGGKCSAELAADKLNKKMSGAFTALIGSTAKYGLITSKKGQLEITQLYRDHKLAYTSDEADSALIKSFLSPALFTAIFDRFKGKELPINHFEKMLIREFDVPENISSRVSKYFIDGAKLCGIIGPNNVLSTSTAEVDTKQDESKERPEKENAAYETSEHELEDEKSSVQSDSGKFSVRIKGPGMDSLIIINEQEDLLIVDAMLKKVKKQLKENDELAWGDDD